MFKVILVFKVKQAYKAFRVKLDSKATLVSKVTLVFKVFKVKQESRAKLEFKE